MQILTKSSAFLIKSKFINIGCYFSRLIEPKDRKYISEDQWRANLRDDLYFSHQFSHLNGGIEAVCENVKKQQELKIEPKGTAQLLYNMGVKNLQDKGVFEVIEQQLYQLRGRFSPRLAFGCLYGSLKCEASVYQIEFFFEEVKELAEHLSVIEVIELIEASAINKTYSRKKIIKFLQQYLIGALEQDYENRVSQFPKLNQRLFNALIGLEMYDEKIWEPLLKTLVKKRGSSNLFVITNYYEQLYILNESGKFYRKLDLEIDHFKQKLNSKDDYKWRYNVEQRRLYTYQEIKNSRENYTHTNQLLGLTSPFHKERLIKYEEILAIQSGKEEEKQIKVMEKQLNQLVYDQFFQTKADQDELVDEELTEEQEQMVSEMEAKLANQDDQNESINNKNPSKFQRKQQKIKQKKEKGDIDKNSIPNENDEE